MRLSAFKRNSLALLLCAYQTNATYLVPRQDSPSNSSIPTNSTIPSSNSTTPTNSTEDVHKAGLAWANADRVDIEQFLTTGKVSWYYTWSIWPSGIRNLDLEFVPMLWGPKSLTEFESKINDTVRTAERSSTPVTAILGMNEPEQPGQSDMTASEGVEFWKEHMEPLRERFGVRLGSPGVSSAPSAKTWLEDFFKECDADCNVDFIAMHWYGTNPDHFIAHLWDYYFAFNKTIWVTEWACHNFVERREQCEEDEVIEFMNKTQAFMDETPWVERYAWFGALTDLQGVNSDNALLDNKGRISDLGRQYIGEINARGEALDDSGVEPGSSRLTITLTASLVLSIVMLFL